MKMKREILILDCVEIKCPLVLIYVFKEFAGYFESKGHMVKIIKNINEIHDNSLVLMGDGFNKNICPDDTHNPVNLLYDIAPNAIYIGWYWHNINTEKLKYFIYTYENMLNIYAYPNRIDELVKIRSYENNSPLLLRANDVPELIGTYQKNIQYDYCYMGWKYCSNLVPQKFKGFYAGTYDHNKFIDYPTRKNIYLQSLFALGFQSPENILTEHVSQRIYEGLAYGCIVLTNSMPACTQTNQIAIYVDSREQIESIMEYYISNPDLIEKKKK